MSTVLYVGAVWEAHQISSQIEQVKAYLQQKSGDAAPEVASPGDGTKGCIYCVKGENTSSGKDYVGSTDNMGQRKRDKTDGRDREGAEVIDTYPKGNREERRRKEQQAINDKGGVDSLDNRRNEVAEKKWEGKNISPPPQ